ncbi:MAG: sulfatase-like hydrolase/transferase, partial [Planctomycetota bacterium]
KGQRFFLYLAHNMPHAPVFASPRFQGRSDGGRYGDVIEEIDWSVGQVMQALKDTGADSNTLVVFTSDNGPWTMFGPHGGTAGPLRGEKGTSWEGGYRVPGIFRWPGKIKPGEFHGLVANLDLYATFATLAGGDQPNDLKGYISKDLTGVLLRGEPSPRTRWLYNTGSIAFRSGNYKIHLSTKTRSGNPDTRKREPIPQHDPPLLYDLSVDLGEQSNINQAHPEIVDRLLDEMAAFRGETGGNRKNN